MRFDIKKGSALYLTQYLFSLILFLIVQGTEISLKSVAVAYFSQDVDFEQPDVALLCLLSKAVYGDRYINLYI